MNVSFYAPFQWAVAVQTYTPDFQEAAARTLDGNAREPTRLVGRFTR